MAILRGSYVVSLVTGVFFFAAVALGTGIALAVLAMSSNEAPSSTGVLLGLLAVLQAFVVAPIASAISAVILSMRHRESPEVCAVLSAVSSAAGFLLYLGVLVGFLVLLFPETPAEGGQSFDPKEFFMDSVLVVIPASLTGGVVGLISAVASTRRLPIFEDLGLDEEASGSPMPEAAPEEAPVPSASSKRLKEWKADAEPSGETTDSIHCPHCKAPFDVGKQRPLVVQCPACGKRGRLT
ncbi:MAG: hypothetical protein ACT4PT_06785 [Methanobacteriota archaeon]